MMHNNTDIIREATHRLLQYIEKENYKGYDPYDGLTSPLFKLPILKSNKQIRFLSQQLIKRFPFNIRPLLGIKKKMNPVTLGLCVQAYSNILNDVNKEEINTKIDLLLHQLTKLIAPGYHGACWGYNFQWEARYASIPAYEPTVVATGIITNSLYIAFSKTKNPVAGALLTNSCEFVMHDLNRSTDAENDFCFSYSPFDHEKVFNASMKGARLLSQGYRLTGNEEWKAAAKKAVAYVMKYQQDDGSWIYSQSDSGKWIDNYHTGYILDCLSEYQLHCSDNSFDQHLKKGISYYVTHFFKVDGQPKFYNHKTWPADCTAGAQSLLTLLRFGEIQLAEKVALWMISNMQDKKGYFYFRKYPYSTNKISFMRWSNAWMFAGLTELLNSIHELKREEYA